MKVVGRDIERRSIKLRVESSDDLWYLNQILRPGVIVGSMTMRKVDTREDMVRADSPPRKKMYISIRITGTEFQQFTDTFRIMGEIVEAPPEVMGHHSINLDVGETLDVYSETLEKRDLDLIDEAVRRDTGHKGYIISIDDSDCVIYRLWDNGVEEIADFGREGGGKRYSGGGSFDQFYSNIVEDFKPVYNDMAPLIIIGPSFFKKSLEKRLREGLGDRLGRVNIVDTSVGGRGALKDLVRRRGELGEVLDEVRYLQEAEMVDKLMKNIARGSGAAYGMDEVEKALNYGAVESLLICEGKYRTEDGERLMERAKETGSGVIVISSGHEEGRMFEEMGGVGAILRFEIG